MIPLATWGVGMQYWGDLQTHVELVENLRNEKKGEVYRTYEIMELKAFKSLCKISNLGCQFKVKEAKIR